MRISNITLVTKANKSILSAQVRFGKEKSQVMYFSVPEAYKAYIAQDASPFLAALLLPCMKTRENITIDGSVSQELSQKTKQIMDLVADWNIGLHRIQVTASVSMEDSFTSRTVGSFFSAGVDSFYTYLKNQDLVRSKKISTSEKITSFILVHGFDIELKNKQLFSDTLANIKKIAQSEHVAVIPVETNVSSIIVPKLTWEYSHGGALAAVALFLRKEFKKVYIAGAVRKDQLFPYGTHPDLDPLWGTETLHIVHDGTEKYRMEKVGAYIAKSDLALRYLRVCNQNRKGLYNCGKCIKCLKTMMELTAFHALKKSVAFPQPLDLKLVSNMYYDYSLLYHLQGLAILEELQKQNIEPDLQRAIEDSLEKSKHVSFKRKIFKSLALLDRRYNNRRFYFWVFRMTNDNDRNRIFKFLSAVGLIK